MNMAVLLDYTDRLDHDSASTVIAMPSAYVMESRSFTAVRIVCVDRHSALQRKYELVTQPNTHEPAGTSFMSEWLQTPEAHLAADVSCNLLRDAHWMHVGALVLAAPPI